MVRQGDFELRLVQGDGQPFPEVQHKGKAIAVAAPGREFEVQVIRHAAAYPAPQPHGSFLNVRLDRIAVLWHGGHGRAVHSSVCRRQCSTGTRASPPPPACPVRLHPVCRLS